MSTISRRQFDTTLSNHAIDVHDPDLEAAVVGSGLDLAKLDRSDGAADGRISGQAALENLYADLDALDRRTAGLGSEKERGIYKALKGAAIAPVPISEAQGRAVATAARQLLAEDAGRSTGVSPWAFDGISACANPAVSSSSYAEAQSWKCNVFAGETLHRAGLAFPLNDQNHYVLAGHIPRQADFFQKLSSIEQAREGDVLAIDRGDDPGHLEIVTGVERDANGQVKALKAIGAHEGGLAEGTATAASFLKSGARAQGALVVPGETLRILRPISPPHAPEKPSTQFPVPIKG